MCIKLLFLLLLTSNFAFAYDIYERNPEFDGVPKSNSSVIAVIDTGIDIRHNLLKDNIAVNLGEIPGNDIDDDENGFTDDIIGWDFGENDNNPNDFLIKKKERPSLMDSIRNFNIRDLYERVIELISPEAKGHGTHVSGIVIQKNPNAMILPIRVDFKKPNALGQIKNSIEYALLRKARIINMSLGGPFVTNEKPEEYKIQNQIKQMIIDNPEVLFIIAAGNNGRSLVEKNIFPGGLDISNVLTIGASDINLTLANFTNWGEGIVEIYTNGVDIESAWPGNATKQLSGTSMSTPYITGLASQILYKDPEISVKALKEAIYANGKVETLTKELKTKDETQLIEEKAYYIE